MNLDARAVQEARGILYANREAVERKEEEMLCIGCTWCTNCSGIVGG